MKCMCSAGGTAVSFVAKVRTEWVLTLRRPESHGEPFPRLSRSASPLPPVSVHVASRDDLLPVLSWSLLDEEEPLFSAFCFTGT